MKTFLKSGILIVFALVLFLGNGPAYGASNFPEKPITLAITSGVGSGIDATGRFVAAIIGKHQLLPQPIVVETKTGGSGMVGMSYVAGKKKDPYYLIGFTPIHILTPLRGQSPINYKNFTPICNLSLDVHALMVNYNSRFKSIKDVIDAAKAKPETITTGGTHVGGTESMNNWILEQAAGVKMKYISFGGGSDTFAALLGGHIDLAFGNPSEVIEMVKAKKVRILGVLTEKRLTAVPDWPTLKEQGYNVVGAPI
ncbi:MAG: tripartite tricarboxylate transporter substrate binding protein, partial [bacterium]